MHVAIGYLRVAFGSMRELDFKKHGLVKTELYDEHIVYQKEINSIVIEIWHFVDTQSISIDFIHPVFGRRTVCDDFFCERQEDLDWLINNSSIRNIG